MSLYFTRETKIQEPSLASSSHHEILPWVMAHDLELGSLRAILESRVLLVLTTHCFPVISLHRRHNAGPSAGGTWNIQLSIFQASHVEAQIFLCSLYPRGWHVTGHKIKCTVKDAQGPILWQSSALYKFLMPWIRLATLPAIKGVFQPTREDTSMEYHQDTQPGISSV